MITAAFCTAAKRDLLNGIHRPEDEYRLALYGLDADLGPDTETYQPTGEARGLGYYAGGLLLKGRKVTLDRQTGCLDFEDAIWPDSTITAAGALFYNASRGDAALAVLFFGGELSSVNGPFTVRFPAPTKDTAVVRIG